MTSWRDVMTSRHDILSYLWPESTDFNQLKFVSIVFKVALQHGTVIKHVRLTGDVMTWRHDVIMTYHDITCYLWPDSTDFDQLKFVSIVFKVALQHGIVIRHVRLTHDVMAWRHDVTSWHSIISLARLNRFQLTQVCFYRFQGRTTTWDSYQEFPTNPWRHGVTSWRYVMTFYHISGQTQPISTNSSLFLSFSRSHYNMG